MTVRRWVMSRLTCVYLVSGIYSAGVGVAGRDPDHGRVVIGAGVAGVSR